MDIRHLKDFLKLEKINKKVSIDQIISYYTKEAINYSDDKMKPKENDYEKAYIKTMIEYK